MQMLNSDLQNEIDKTFQIQKKYSENLRKSTCRDRLQILERFEKAFKESIKSIKQQMMIFVDQKLKLICLKLW